MTEATTYLVDLRDVVRALVTELPQPLEIWFFGSRAQRTGSKRSDVDLLIVDPDASLSPAALMEWLAADDEQRSPLDIFLSRDPRTADSVVNGSVLRSATTVVDMVGGVRLWSRDTGPVDDSTLPWVQEFRRGITFQRGVLSDEDRQRVNLDARLAEYREKLHIVQREKPVVIKPSAEAQRAWELIDLDIGELMRLRRVDTRPWHEDHDLLELLSDGPTRKLRSTPALELHDQLRNVCLEHSAGVDLMALVADELAADPDRTAAAPPGSPVRRLSEVSDKLSQRANTASEEAARALVRVLWRDDTQQRAKDRLLRRTRSDYLDRLSMVMIPLVILLLALIALTAKFPHAVIVVLLLTAFAGAVGSMLGGVLRFRDLSDLTNIQDLTIGTLAQPFVGGVAALFVFLLLESHIVVLPGISATGTPSWQALGVYGFAAGFSEPFFLGVLRRVTGSSQS